MNRNIRVGAALFAGALFSLALLAPAQAIPVRKQHTQTAQAVRATVTFSNFSASDLSESFAAAMPNGAHVVGVFANVGTAFNNLASMSIGWTGSTSALMADTTLLATSAGSKTGILFPVLTANRTPLVTLSTYSAVPTAGSVTLTILYYPHAN